MRLMVINCIFLAWLATALAEDRPRRHLHQIKDMIINKLFRCNEPNCIQPEAPDVKFYSIPGFNDVVIKAVPKGTLEPAVYEKIPPNSHIGIVGSYLGTNTLNETYNALLGVKNLLTSGILNGKAEVLKEVGLLPSKAQFIAKPIKPCLAPPVSLPIQPVPVLVQPPKVPVFPTQYSYKQVNQDGSLTTYTSSLELGNGVRVTESGKTLPFIIDRVRKIPVRLPVPVLPEVSKIIVSEVAQPVTYAYQQIQDGRMTSYMGLSPIFMKRGPVVVTETGIPPSPMFLMDRIEKVAAIASNPRGPYLNVAPTPVKINAAVVKPVPPVPTGYSYSQMDVNGGITTHLSSGANGAVIVTDNGISTAPINVPSLPEKNPFRHPTGQGAYSFSHSYADGRMNIDAGVPAESVNVVEYNPVPISVSPGVPPPPSSFSYKQIGAGKMTTYTGSSMFEERSSSPAVIVHGMPHPIPPPHITDRIEKVAAGAKYNRPPLLAVPVPNEFVSIPPIQPVNVLTAPGADSFNYKHVHSDGSVTSYGGSSLTTEQGKPHLPPSANMAMPFPQGKVRVFESPMYSGPFPMNPVNLNAVKPSTPVSGSYSYKISNSRQGSHPPVGPVDERVVDTFAPPPPLAMRAPVPVQGCIDEDSAHPAVHIDSPFTVVDPLAPVPLTYSYKQISHSNPNPFVVVNVEDPVRDVKKVSSMDQTSSHLPSASINVVEHKPTKLKPAPFVPAPIMPMATPQAAIEASPPSSFSYKQVTSQEHQPHLPSEPTLNFMEHSNTGRSAPPPMINSRTPQIHENTVPSSFSYKQVTSQENQLLVPTQPTVNFMEHRHTRPSAPMINLQKPEVQKDNAPSSFSYKQVTNDGVYEYSDEFPNGVKTNLSPSAVNPQENLGDVHIDQKPSAVPMPSSPMSTPTNVMPSPTIATPNPTIPMPVRSNPMPFSPGPTFNSQDTLANNPIIIPDSTPGSTFSFKSSNPDGSTITLKDDGHNSIAVQLENATRTEAVSQEPTMSGIDNYPPGTQVLQEATPAPAVEEGPVSGHAKPIRRRIVRKKKPVVHRGDIPEGE
ncbi:uncharacterized protein LOC133528342 [Cydia pomonella]|uniref:uncharacterized protein LOC133528342 n=1 Tax=Cydia pomonella TaxID=82600 RepID=UPI002ADDDB9D|nr:uncharacterized protein LOC133528342 [Cydia pomonella]